MIQFFNKKMNKKRKGFTLIELIVVVAILGILAAIAIPRLSGSRDAAQLRADQATARTIISAVSIAEATYGTGFTQDNVDEFLDEPVADMEGTWTVTLTQPIVVSKGGTPIDLNATN